MLRNLRKKPLTKTDAGALRSKEADLLCVGELRAPLVRSARRKTVSIKVEAGQVRVLAPVYVARKEIETFLRSKYSWVVAKAHEQREQIAAAQRDWCTGAQLPFRGDTIRLNLVKGTAAMSYLQNDCLHLAVPGRDMEDEERIRQRVAKWYRRQAEKQVEERLGYWEGVTAIRATASKVRSYKARWGSCSHEGEVTINWKLIMAPPAVLDYVIVHELCHIVHFNHSPAYWALVQRFVPNYKQYKTWLKHNCLSLEL